MLKLFAFLIAVAMAQAAIADPSVTLKHVRGNVYVADDTFYQKENSAVYLGPDHVTVVGATWTPDTARLLAGEIAKITREPITEVIDTNYHPDRAGGNAYFRQMGAEIMSTEMTRDAMAKGWDDVVAATRQGIPDYPLVPLTLPDRTFPGDFTLQNGNVKAFYLGPSHTPDGIFVYFPQEKILYGGCILKEQLGSLAYADLAEYPNTLRKLKALHLGYTTIIAGHYSALHGPELVDQYLKLLANYHAPRMSAK